MMENQDMQGLMGAGVTPVGPESQAPQEAAPAPMQGMEQGGIIDTKQIEAGIEVPPNLKPMYDKIVLSGMRIMFSKESHKLFIDQLQKEGPLAKKIADGITGLMYLMWTESNKSIPPQLIIPATTALTLRAFDYVQQTGDPEATKEVLGQSLEGAIDGVMRGFGGSADTIEQAIPAAQGQGAMPQQGAPQSAPPSGGLMDAMGGVNG